jgi:hypothetical protein
MIVQISACARCAGRPFGVFCGEPTGARTIIIVARRLFAAVATRQKTPIHHDEY